MTEIRSHRTEVIRQLLLQLRSKFTEFGGNVINVTDLDFSADGAAIEKAKIPALYLTGPRMPRNDLYTSHEKPTERYGTLLPGTQEPSRFRAYTAEEAIDLVFGLVVVHDNQDLFLSLVDRMHGYFLNGKFVSAEKCPGEPDKGTNRYEIDLTKRFQTNLMANRSNLKQAMGEMIVRGVLVSDGEVFKEGYVAADEPNLTLLKK